MSTDRTEAEQLADIERRIHDAANGTFGRADGRQLLAELRRARAEIAHLQALVESEREGRHKLEAALRQKDNAMGVLFARLSAAGVDCSDLLP